MDLEGVADRPNLDWFEVQSIRGQLSDGESPTSSPDEGGFRIE